MKGADLTFDVMQVYDTVCLMDPEWSNVCTPTVSVKEEAFTFYSVQKE
jgi:hypothetical protein